MSGYIGTQPVPQATQTRDSFTATAGQTSFATGGYTPSFLDVYLNGVHLQNGTDYTASNGSDVILTTGAAADDVLEVVAYSTFELVSPTFSGTVTADGLTVDTDTLHVNSTNNRVGIGELSPSSPLHVNGGGTNAVATFESTDAVASGKFVDSDQTQGVFVGAKGDDFYIQAGGNEKVRIDSGGRVTMPYQPVANVGINVTNTANVLYGAGVSTLFADIAYGGMVVTSDRVTVPVAGKYYISARQLNLSDAGEYFNILVNGLAVAFGYNSDTTALHDLNVDKILALSANDYIQVHYTTATAQRYGGGHANLAIYLIA